MHEFHSLSSLAGVLLIGGSFADVNLLTRVSSDNDGRNKKFIPQGHRNRIGLTTAWIQACPR